MSGRAALDGQWLVALDHEPQSLIFGFVGVGTLEGLNDAYRAEPWNLVNRLGSGVHGDILDALIAARVYCEFDRASRAFAFDVDGGELERLIAFGGRELHPSNGWGQSRRGLGHSDLVTHWQFA